VYGDLVFSDRDNQPVRYWESKPFKKGLLEKGWTPPHPTLFLHKRVYQKHRLFDTRFRIAGDYDFILRIKKHTFGEIYICLFRQNTHYLGTFGEI
jgi:glycosyltransferase